MVSSELWTLWALWVTKGWWWLKPNFSKNISVLPCFDMIQCDNSVLIGNLIVILCHYLAALTEEAQMLWFVKSLCAFPDHCIDCIRLYYLIILQIMQTYNNFSGIFHKRISWEWSTHRLTFVCSFIYTDFQFVQTFSLCVVAIDMSKNITTSMSRIMIVMNSGRIVMVMIGVNEIIRIPCTIGPIKFNTAEMLLRFQTNMHTHRVNWTLELPSLLMQPFNSLNIGLLVPLQIHILSGLTESPIWMPIHAPEYLVVDNWVFGHGGPQLPWCLLWGLEWKQWVRCRIMSSQLERILHIV